MVPGPHLLAHPPPALLGGLNRSVRRARRLPRDSLAVRAQAAASPGARSLVLRAQPLARRFTTGSWWDDGAAVRAFVRADPHRAAMVRRRPGMQHVSNRAQPGTAGVVPTVTSAGAAAVPW